MNNRNRTNNPAMPEPPYAPASKLFEIIADALTVPPRDDAPEVVDDDSEDGAA